MGFHVKLCKEYLNSILLILLSINIGPGLFFGISIQFLLNSNTFLPYYIMPNKGSLPGDSDFLRSQNVLFVLQLTLWYIDLRSRSLQNEPLKINAFFYTHTFTIFDKSKWELMKVILKIYSFVPCLFIESAEYMLYKG